MAATRYKGIMSLRCKKENSLCPVGKAKGECSKLVISDKQGDVVTLGDNALHVEMPLQFLKVAEPEYSAADIAPYRVKLGTVNQTVALHDFIDNILYLNQSAVFPYIFGIVRQQHIGDEDVIIVPAEG